MRRVGAKTRGGVGGEGGGGELMSALLHPTGSRFAALSVDELVRLFWRADEELSPADNERLLDEMVERGIEVGEQEEATHATL